MKTYERKDALETLSGILSIQDKRFLAEKLSSLILKYVGSNGCYKLDEIQLHVESKNNGYEIKIGEE